ncbi:MAG TPA: hypothetical protein VK590_00165 [Saprospiraceae bacterium]|nr:hypothetical protein [Saprospiraceae bacterium]
MILKLLIISLLLIQNGYVNYTSLKKDSVKERVENTSQKKLIELLLLDEFADTLIIKLDNKIIIKAYFLTDQSDGASGQYIKLKVDTKRPSTLFFYNTKNEVLYKFSLENIKNFLYVWRERGTWIHRFEEKRLQLE